MLHYRGALKADRVIQDPLTNVINKDKLIEFRCCTKAQLPINESLCVVDEDTANSVYVSFFW